jgi:type II secretion system protein G
MRSVGRAAARRRARDRQAGFTLLELIVVVAMIGILAAIAVPSLIERPIRAREAVLKHNLMAIRDALDQHYGDKGYYPETLEALVEAGYFRVVPQDPITGSNETWVLEYEEIDPEEAPAETDQPEGGGPGVIDVHSGSEELALDGSPYKEW